MALSADRFRGYAIGMMMTFLRAGLCLLLTQGSFAQALGPVSTAAGARAQPPSLPSSAVAASSRQSATPEAGLAPVAATPAALASPVPAAAPTVSDYGRLTGAVHRTQVDPGPVKKMWIVYDSAEELSMIQEPLEKIKAANPGVEVHAYQAEKIIPHVKDKHGKKTRDASDTGLQKIFDRMLAEGAEFVLASNQELYGYFRNFRDTGLAQNIPIGFAGRKFVSVDMPRASLDPAALSDPAQYSAQRYLWLGAKNVEKVSVRAVAGMEEIRRDLDGILKTDVDLGHGSAKKDEDLGLATRLATKLMMKMSGQADSPETSALREKAHHLAAYMKREKIDVIATDDPQATKVLGLMKKMGYHKSVPVVWASRQEPGDTTALNMAVVPAPWQSAAPNVFLAPKPNLSDAVGAAVKMERLPENFMEMGGVSVRDFQPAVDEAVAKALPGERPAGVSDVHFMLTNGNGVRRKGDANAFGHFGMAVTDEKGKAQVWTVQYNDGGSFTGGLGDLKQLSLAEYLYSLWYLPGAVGQAIPLAETAVAPVFDFILRGVDEAQLLTMRRKAAEINARHLRGKDNYMFTNDGGMTNCISLATQLLRAVGFRIPETNIQDPAGQVMNMFAELSRWLLHERIDASRFGFVVFERPAHAGPEHYRIASTALASPYFNRPKPWERMHWWEKMWRAVIFPWSVFKAIGVPSNLEAFSAMASHRVTVGPNSRRARVEENAQSPILELRAGARNAAELRSQTVVLMKELTPVEERIIKAIGFDGWKPNPAQSLAEQARARHGALDAQARKRLDADLATHHRLSVRLQLANIDEMIESRHAEYLTLKLADLTGKHIRKAAEIFADYELVKGYRDRVLIEDRSLTSAETATLDNLNARLEGRLSAARAALLNQAGSPAPQSVKMMLGQVTSEDLKELEQIGLGSNGKVKGKAGN